MRTNFSWYKSLKVISMCLEGFETLSVTKFCNCITLGSAALRLHRFPSPISSNHDSCISAPIGRSLWGVPDLSDGAHVAWFGWLRYILSNTRRWGRGSVALSRKCQTVVAGSRWRRSAILFWRNLAAPDTCLAVDRRNTDLHLHLQSACSNKQRLMGFIQIGLFWRSCRVKHFDLKKNKNKKESNKARNTKNSQGALE